MARLEDDPRDGGRQGELETRLERRITFAAFSRDGAAQADWITRQTGL